MKLYVKAKPKSKKEHVTQIYETHFIIAFHACPSVVLTLRGDEGGSRPKKECTCHSGRESRNPYNYLPFQV